MFAIEGSLDDPQIRARAEAWTGKYAPNPQFRFALGIGPYHCDTEYFCNLAWARVQIALGHFEEASMFVAPALQAARECGLAFRVAELSIAEAFICDGLGKSLAALGTLKEAFELARTFGYTQFFDDSRKLDRLLQQAAGRKPHGQDAGQLLDFLHSLRARRKVTGTGARVEKQHSDLIEPLSEREVEVLRLLSTGIPPGDAAKKLFLSPFTLKAHTQNIYAKLGVHSRIEAINKARELGLL
jgi:LuxR family maltose regulon positive regulatory protein